jgi:ParB family chromosome partitioning protein
LIPAGSADKSTNILSATGLSQATGERVKLVPVASIVPNRLQPRKIFDEEKITELAASIKEQGIIQPLIVNNAGANRYELIAGERRLRAAKTAGLVEVPVVIKNVNTESLLELSIIENIQREDLNAIEEAVAMQELINQFQYTQDEVAKRLGKSRVAVANSLRLLNLPKIVQDDVSAGRISAGHARAILSVQGLQAQLKLRERILNSALTVRDVERMIQGSRPAASRGARRSAAQLTPQMKFILDELTKKCATKVRLEPDKERKGGRIVIDYYTAQDLDRIYNVIVK